MISIEDARKRISAAIEPLPLERIPLSEAVGRVLGEDAIAQRTQPPADLSAMDGYAVRSTDVSQTGGTLKVIGESRAGKAFAGRVEPGEAVRIFTGAPVPAGTDTILIQENAERLKTGAVKVTHRVDRNRHIRKAGLDFAEGETVLEAGLTLMPRHNALLAAANIPWISVRRRPRIAVLATGDELVRPGETVSEFGIVESVGPALTGFLRVLGAIPVDLGIAPDDADGLKRMADGARGADFLVTVGGASVGDHDLVKQVLGEIGLEIDFWKIAMRPGKPLIFGRMHGMPVLGLPGNPVSALLCALIFLAPAIDRFLGRPETPLHYERAVTATDLPANGARQDFMRAAIEDRNGLPIVRAFTSQDSSMLSTLARADCFIIRPPHAPAAKSGDEILLLRLGCPL